MNDLISRQAAIDRFENLSYADWNQGASTTWANAFSECADMIRELPSEYVVEVVRCWNCIWWDDCPSSTITPNFHKCKRVGRMSMPSDGFCSFGEQKDV